MEGKRNSGAIRPVRDANGASLLNMQLQAVLGLNAEGLSKLKEFVADKGPELLGDLFCPWAKWALILVTSLTHTDPAFAARLFGTSSPHPLQIIVSTLHSATEEASQSTAFAAELRTGALVVCRAMILMLIMVMGDFGWKGLIAFHIGLFVAQTNLQFSKEAPHLFFQAIHVFLYVLDAVAPTFFWRFLLAVAGWMVAISLHCTHMLLLDFLVFASCALLLVFYTPLWFGVCVSSAIFARTVMTDDNDANGLTAAAIIIFATFCVVRLVVYASGMGFCGAIVVCLCPIVVASWDRDAQGMVTPLPLVCILMSCLYTPFWVGLCFTSMVVFTLAAANDNVKAMLWWFVSFVALHLLSYAFSRNFSVAAMCFMGSYFSYGCIL